MIETSRTIVYPVEWDFREQVTLFFLMPVCTKRDVLIFFSLFSKVPMPTRIVLDSRVSRFQWEDEEKTLHIKWDRENWLLETYQVSPGEFAPDLLISWRYQNKKRHLSGLFQNDWNDYRAPSKRCLTNMGFLFK